MLFVTYILHYSVLFPCGVIGNTTDFGSVFLGSTPNKETVAVA